MDVKHFITLLLGMQSVYSKVQIEQKEKNRIVTSVNQAYSNVAIPAEPRPRIVWNYNLEGALKAFHAAHGGDWFFEDSGIQYNNDILVHFRMFRLPLEPEFKDFNVTYWFHDTCNNKVDDVWNIFKHRIEQKHCFKYSNCDPLVFTSFMSCKSMEIPRESGHECSWSWRYYPQIIRQDLVSFACIRLGRPGPFTPSKQKDSFCCLASLDVNKPISGDRPYLKR